MHSAPRLTRLVTLDESTIDPVTAWRDREADARTAAQVRAPTLMIVGGDSPTFVQEEVRSLAAGLPDLLLGSRPTVLDEQAGP